MELAIITSILFIISITAVIIWTTDYVEVPIIIFSGSILIWILGILIGKECSMVEKTLPEIQKELIISNHPTDSTKVLLIYKGEVNAQEITITK